MNIMQHLTNSKNDGQHLLYTQFVIYFNSVFNICLTKTKNAMAKKAKKAAKKKVAKKAKKAAKKKK